MAIQTHKKQAGGQINRTPAPDEISQIHNPHGGSGYGQNAPQPSSVAPGKAVRSALAQNLIESSSDDGENVLQTIIEKGIAGRGDNIPADGNDQMRPVSATLYPLSPGMKRQQDPNFFTKK